MTETGIPTTFGDKLPEAEAVLAALVEAAKEVGLRLAPKLVPAAANEDEHIAVDEDTLVDIYPAGVPVRTLSGSVTYPGFVVTSTNIVPASRWVPEDADITDEIVTRNLTEAVTAALACVLERRLSEFHRAASEFIPDLP